MRRRLSRAAKKKPHPKTKLGLPDLDQAKAAVLGSLHSPESQRGYQHSINEFINWYCSEPRLSFNKTVVTRYRIHLESRPLAPGTVNVRLAAIRRLADEAADSGLLSPELGAGIRPVKGARRLGCTSRENWLTAEQARMLWQRDRAILSILLGCGLRRRELRLLFQHMNPGTIDFWRQTRRPTASPPVDSREENPRGDVPAAICRRTAGRYVSPGASSAVARHHPRPPPRVQSQPCRRGRRWQTRQCCLESAVHL